MRQTLAFQIVRHAFFMVYSNFGQALLLSIGPFLLALGAIYLLSETFSIGAITVMMGLNPASADPVIIAILILMAFIFVFTNCWIAVGWHRFILLQEYVQILPKLSDRPILSYLWRSVVIGLWILLIVFAFGLFVGMVVTVVLALAGPNFTSVLEFGLNLSLTAITSYAWFRMGLVLPALAVNEPMSIRTSLRETEQFGKTIWQVVFILIFLNLIARLFSDALIDLPLIVQMSVNAAIYWVTFMVGLSILTTFYGHLIEKRPLAD